VLNRWRNIYPSFFDPEAEKAGVIALPAATALIWLDLPCKSAVQPSSIAAALRGMTRADHDRIGQMGGRLLDARDIQFVSGHVRLLAAFGGAKLRLTSRSQVNQLVAGLSAKTSC
jgi:hypothetical protein